MQFRTLTLSLSLTLLVACAPNHSGVKPADTSEPTSDEWVQEHGIYGTDNRHEYFAEPNPAVRAVADSTLALIYRENLTMEGSEVRISGPNFGTSYNLCPSERFREQETGAMCSGFLVANDVIVTAGHCILTDDDCKTRAFVFGYAYKEPGQAPEKVPASEVYSCKKVLHSQSYSWGADFAVVRLDRPVVGHKPLKVRKSGSVAVGDSLIVIGHPTGLPQKIADGGQVRSVRKYSGYFLTNLDTYGGNSGSAVFNAKSLEVEGVLVRGDADFVTDSANHCSVSSVCESDQCGGEAVTAISEVIPKIPSLGTRFSRRR